MRRNKKRVKILLKKKNSKKSYHIRINFCVGLETAVMIAVRILLVQKNKFLKKMNNRKIKQLLKIKPNWLLTKVQIRNRLIRPRLKLMPKLLPQFHGD